MFYLSNNENWYSRTIYLVSLKSKLHLLLLIKFRAISDVIGDY